jgi:hypothetical protein
LTNRGSSHRKGDTVNLKAKSEIDNGGVMPKKSRADDAGALHHTRVRDIERREWNWCVGPR